MAVLYIYFGLFSLWSFGYKLYSYGHNLAPTASVKVDPFMPPLFGHKKLANFEVYSYPAAASYALAAVGVVLLAALVLAWREAPPRGERGSPVGRMILPAVALLLALAGDEMASVAAAKLEGRPSAGDALAAPGAESTPLPRARSSTSAPGPIGATSTSTAA